MGVEGGGNVLSYTGESNRSLGLNSAKQETTTNGRRAENALTTNPRAWGST